MSDDDSSGSRDRRRDPPEVWAYHGERRAGPQPEWEHRWTADDPVGEIIVFVVLANRSGLTEAEALDLCREQRRREAEELREGLGL